MTNDTLAVIIIFLLTLNLLVVGVYIVLVLKEIKETIKHVNSLLEVADDLAESFAKPFVDASGFITGITKGISLIKSFQQNDDEDDDEEE